MRKFGSSVTLYVKQVVLLVNPLLSLSLIKEATNT